MSDAITGIDHCIVLVNDLADAHACITRLGFAPAPRGVHSDHMGTHNHCVMLERGYFEVLAVRMPTERNQRWRDVLARREGLSAIALQTGDAHAAHDWFHAQGVASKDLVDFARPVELEPGVTREASFTTVTLPADVAPVPMFLCQHHTPDVVWRPEYLAHPNRVNGVVGLTMMLENPGLWLDPLQRAFGAHRVVSSEQGLTITTDAGWIRLLEPGACAQAYAHVPLDPTASAPCVVALTLQSADLGGTRGVLDANGVPHHAGPDGAVCIAPADACGALLEIVAA